MIRSRMFVLADQASLEPGWYWIRRAEPDGPPFWEVARFDGFEWTVRGSSYPKQPTRNSLASNAWQIGERVPDPPE